MALQINQYAVEELGPIDPNTWFDIDAVDAPFESRKLKFSVLQSELLGGLTATNGLTKGSSTNVKLGGSILENTLVTAEDTLFSLEFKGGTTGALNAVNSIRLDDDLLTLGQNRTTDVNEFMNMNFDINGGLSGIFYSTATASGSMELSTSGLRLRASNPVTPLVEAVFTLNAGNAVLDGRLHYRDGTEGNIGDVLVSTDAQGQVQWAAAPAGPNLYNANGTLTADRTITTDGFNLITSGTGNLGLGVTPTNNKLRVNGKSRFDDFIGYEIDPVSAVDIVRTVNATDYIGYRNTANTAFNTGNFIRLTSSSSGTLEPLVVGRNTATGRGITMYGVVGTDTLGADDSDAAVQIQGRSGSWGALVNARAISMGNAGTTRYQMMANGRQLWTTSSNSLGGPDEAFEFVTSPSLNWLLRPEDATVGVTLLSSPTMLFGGRYWDGAASQDLNSSIQQIVDATTPTGRLVIANNGNSGIEINELGQLIAPNMPTASAGLPTGALWSNAGVINIV